MKTVESISLNCHKRIHFFKDEMEGIKRRIREAEETKVILEKRLVKLETIVQENEDFTEELSLIGK